MFKSDTVMNISTSSQSLVATTAQQSLAVTTATSSRSLGLSTNTKYPIPTYSKKEVEAARKRAYACQQCRGTNFVEDYQRGDVICYDCGCVSCVILDTGCEWRNFSSGDNQTEDRSRVGSAQNPNYADLRSTQLIVAGRKGGSIVPTAKVQKTAAERNVTSVLQEIESLCDNYGFVGVRKAAIDIYRRAVDGGLLKGVNSRALMAASIFMACRKTSSPRSLVDIQNITSVDRTLIQKTSKKIETVCNIRVKSSSAADYVENICSQLYLPHSIIRVAIEVAKATKKLDLMGGRSPTTIAATSIYFSCQLLNLAEHKLTTVLVGQHCSVGDSTIRSAYRIMFDNRMKIVEGIKGITKEMLEQLPIC